MFFLLGLYSRQERVLKSGLSSSVRRLAKLSSTSLSNAQASLGLFQERNIGVEGSLGGLFSGETVVELISASHAGFIITLTSGRIAQLTLRDAQGKPRVSIQFLRATEQSSGGLFGSIKGILGGGAFKRDVAAVHTRPLGTKGQMQVLSLTERAELQIWDLDWSGQYRYRGTVDFREVVTRELKKDESPELQGRAEILTMVDFAILEKPSNSSELTALGTELPIDLLVLLRAGTADNQEHVLIEISVEGQYVAISRSRPLITYFTRSNHRARGRPRLLLPKPRHTAFVMFEDAVALASMQDDEGDSPEAQLHASYIQPATFEDTIYIRKSNGLAILDASEEENKSGQASSVAFIKSAGLVRISVMDPISSDHEARLSIKSKIEQAVFHGALQGGNILDFSRIGGSQYSSDDVEEAALAISDQILRSTSSFISTAPTSLDTHLTYKAQALRALVTHVRQNYPVLSKTAMWQLLWDAEQVAAGQQMWKAFEEHVAACSEKKRTATVLDEVCALIQQESDAKEVTSDDDAVRAFFIHSLHRIERILPMAYHFLKFLRNDTDKTSQAKIRLVDEADDIWDKALETVFSFRAENAAAYGIPPEFIEDGVLSDGAEYAELPEFWTSTKSMLKAVVHMAEISRSFAFEEYEKNESTDIGAALAPVISQVGVKNPRLVRLLCLIYQERINWLASRPDDEDQALAEKLRPNYDNERYDQFRALASMGQTEAGMKLAENYGDMHTLTEMVVAEMQFTIELLQDPETEEFKKPQLLDTINQLTAKIGGYFEKFGDRWANAYFNEGFSGGKAGVMLRDAQDSWQDALTRYLRAEPSRAKICWINDITADKDFMNASERLVMAGNEQETRLWSKKVELSMAKLALLAMAEAWPENHDFAFPADDLFKILPQSDLEIIGIQEQLYQHLLPEIRHCIDHQAELEVTMQKVAYKNQDLHSLRQLLESTLDRVLDHAVLSADELIDVLTLIDNCINDNADNNLQGQEFFLALKALNAIALDIPQDRFETLLRLIWKRCYIYDDWVDINSSHKQSDDQVSARLKQTVTWHTFYYALDQGFFDSTSRSARILLPSECLGAGCKPEDLNYRWSNTDLLDPIVHDNKIQDEQLESYITDRRLDQWIESCVEDVKRTIEEKTEESAQRLEQEREFEASSKEVGTNGKKANGYAYGPNGTIKVEDGVDRDGDGEDGNADMS